MTGSQRFWDKVEWTPTCLLWTAAFRTNGYGAYKLDGHVVSAHRQAYIYTHESIPDGLLVCHSCDNRKCVNPEHLWPGTYSDNMQDCSAKGRVFKRQKRFVHGTDTAYRYGCRCDGCRLAHNQAVTRWRKRPITLS